MGNASFFNYLITRKVRNNVKISCDRGVFGVTLDNYEAFGEMYVPLLSRNFLRVICLHGSSCTKVLENVQRFRYFMPQGKFPKIDKGMRTNVPL